MSRSLFFLFATLAVTLALPAASAWQFDVSGLEEAAPPSAMASGSSTTLPVTVSIAQAENQNIICANEATIKVVFTLTGVSPETGFNGTLEPTEHDFTIPAGAHLGAGNPWPGGEASSTLTVEIGQIPPGHTEHAYTVEGKVDGTAPEGCQGDFRAASDSDTVTVPLQPPAADEDENGTEGGGDEGGADGEGAESPAPGPLFVAGALGVAALMRRRHA